MTNEDKPDLVLDNGLRIFYKEDSEKSSLSFNMQAKINSNNENREINFAMNHLIEHCMRVADPIKAQQFEEENLRPKDCQTFYDRIEYRKQGNSKNASKILDCYGELFSNWHMPYIDAEREVIFEEWCNVYNQKDKWHFLTDYFQNENNTFIHPQYGAKLLTDEYVEKNRENIHKWFNNQINYTKDFSKDDVIACAKHIYSASNMTMRCSGNMPKEEFLKLVKASSLTKIPHFNGDNPLDHITDRIASQNLTSKLDLEDFKISSISMSYNIENPEHAKIMKEFLKSRMGRRMKQNPIAYMVDFNAHGINIFFSSHKEQKMQDKMVLFFQEIKKKQIEDKEIILLQKKLNNTTISPQLLKSLIAKVYETVQVSVNRKNKGFVKDKKMSAMNNIEKFRDTGLVKTFQGFEYIDVFDEKFQSYLRKNKLNYPNIVYDSVIEGFVSDKSLPHTDEHKETPKNNSIADFKFKLGSNIANFDENTPVCFRLCIENCTEEDLLKLFKDKGIPVSLASSSNISADQWCLAKREHFVGPDPAHRLDCSYIEVNTPLMRAGDASKELWLAISSFNSIGGYQRGMLLPITADQIVTDFSDEKKYKTGAEEFMQKIEDTERLYPGFKERLLSSPASPSVPQKDGLLYHGGRVYDDPYKIISTAPKSCIYATPNAGMASKYATSDFKESLIQGIVHAYQQNNKNFYTDWAIEEYKPLINNLTATTLTEQEALSRTSETPVLASNKLSEVYLKIKDHGFVKIDPQREDIKHFLQSVKTFDVDKTFAQHRTAIKNSKDQCHTHFLDAEQSAEHLTTQDYKLSNQDFLKGLRYGHNLKMEAPQVKAPYRTTQTNQMTLRRLKELKGLSK